MQKKQTNKRILLVGSGKTLVSIALCLCKAGETVVLLAKDIQRTHDQFAQLLATLTGWNRDSIASRLTIISSVKDIENIELAIAYTNESETEKTDFIDFIEKNIPPDVTIGINTESIPLSSIQKHALQPHRVLGVNWVEPAHANFFLEIICNKAVRPEVAEHFLALANAEWDKDGYIVYSDLGIRAKLFSAMVREALYLVEHEFASIEDIDRACRNDGGYYLPFAGNLRYMDLMGTQSYGMVMEGLNPELNNDERLPDFIKEMEKLKKTGMERNMGFYEYEDGSAEDWAKLVNTFSLEIQELMRSYRLD